MSVDPNVVKDHLSRLIAICRDGEAAYRSAARRATDRRCQSLFGRFADRRQESMSALERLASTHGDGIDRRAFDALPHQVGALLAAGDDTILLHDLRAIEERALIAFSDTLADETPVDVRTVVEERYRDVRRAYGALVRLTAGGAAPPETQVR